MEKVKIVYLLIARTSVNTLNRVYFFSERNENIYWETGNNSIEKKDIDELFSQRKVLALKEPILIDQEQILLVGGYGLEVYISNPLKEEL